MPEKRGKIYLIGAGPGDPGLITVKGLEAIREADCIIYDFLASSRLLDHAKKGAESIYVGKKGRFKSVSQEEINRLIIDKARKGKTVARLKGGDPFIFGRGGEEALEIVKAGLYFEVIPGVSSAVAVPAYAGVPLTHRGLASSVTFITGQEDPGKGATDIAWERLLPGSGTLVLLMGWKNLPLIAKRLIETGWAPSTPVAVIRWGTLPKQTTVTGRLDDIGALTRQRDLKPPVITVIGGVVGLGERLNWFESKPLFGRRVLVTRALDQAGELARILEAQGAEAINFPTIKTVPPSSWKGIDGAIKRLSTYDWAIFTSVNGVKHFFERLGRLGKDFRELKGVKICAVGPMTERAIRALNIKVDLTPKEYRAEAIISALGRKKIKEKRFLLARAQKGREVLPVEIKRLGGRIDVAAVYRTVRPVKEAGGLERLLSDRGVDVVTFTSSSTVTNFMSLFKKGRGAELLKDVRVACIGPVTAETARKAGLKVDIMPKEYTVNALASAMADYFEKR